MSEAPEEARVVEPAEPDAGPGRVADAEERSVDARHVPLQRITAWIVTAVVSFVTMIGLLIFGIFMRPSLPMTLLFFGLWFVVCGTIGVLGHVWPAIEHRHLFYRLSEQGIRIRRGVFWREVITVPRNRIQHTDVSQGPLERRFGLATLLVHTAGTEYARVSLAGLENERALAIRDHLMAGGEDDAI